jgi:tetratricopeptide (TPR) repeat protein
VTGQSWAAAIDSLVLTPLGLDHTVPDDPLAPQPRRATGYRDAFDGLSVALPYRATADAGLWSTVGDIHRFLASLTDASRTPEALRRAIWDDRPDGNAQGWTRDTVQFIPGGARYRLYRQDGAVYGFFATTFLVPERGWIVVLLTNYRRPYNSLREIATQVTSVLDGGTPAPPVETLGSRAEALRRAEGVDRAIACLRDAQCRGSAVVNETELNIWAWFLAERGEPAQAVRAFDALTTLLPTATETWFGLASNALEVGDLATARRAVEAILRLNPTHAGGLSLRARMEEGN